MFYIALCIVLAVSTLVLTYQWWSGVLAWAGETWWWPAKPFDRPLSDTRDDGWNTKR